MNILKFKLFFYTYTKIMRIIININLVVYKCTSTIFIFQLVGY